MNELYEKIKEHEGFRSTPYKCTAGKWTIGYGRNLSDVGLSAKELSVFLCKNESSLPRVRPQANLVGYLELAGVDREFADYLFENDISQAVTSLRHYRRHYDDFTGLPEPVRHALIDMCFNMGIPRLSKFKRMWAAIDKRDFKEAANEALDSLWAKQVQKARVDWVLEQFNKAAKEEV